MRSFHNVLLKYGHENAEMQKRKFDDVTLQYSINPCYPEGFSQTYFPKGVVVATPLWIINTEGHIILNLLPVYRYGHPLSIDTKISTNH